MTGHGQTSSTGVSRRRLLQGAGLGFLACVEVRDEDEELGGEEVMAAALLVGQAQGQLGQAEADGAVLGEGDSDG